MNKSIQKNFKNKLTKKDYLLYLLNRNIFILVSPLIILSLIVVFIFMVDKDGFNSGDLLYLLPILLFILSYFQMKNAINIAIKANSNTNDLTVILEENKYKEKTSNGENSLEYNKFYSYYENKNYYYLYVDKINGLILPKREFNQEELTTIKGYFEKSIKRTKLINTRTLIGITLSASLILCMIILIVSML